MSVFKSMVDKVQAKKRELEKKAAKKAAEKAAEVALERGKQAARTAVEQAGKSLMSAGASIEEALFGPDSAAPSSETEAPARGRAATEPRDEPAERGRRGDDGAARAAEDERFEREVDEELAAMKRRLAGK